MVHRHIVNNFFTIEERSLSSHVFCSRSQFHADLKMRKLYKLVTRILTPNNNNIHNLCNVTAFTTFETATELPFHAAMIELEMVT